MKGRKNILSAQEVLRASKTRIHCIKTKRIEIHGEKECRKKITRPPIFSHQLINFFKTEGGFYVSLYDRNPWLYDSMAQEF